MKSSLLFAHNPVDQKLTKSRSIHSTLVDFLCIFVYQTFDIKTKTKTKQNFRIDNKPTQRQSEPDLQITSQT